MANRGVGGTALGAAVCRLIEQSEPERTRLFEDPVVGELVGAPVRAMMKLGVMRRLALGRMDAITRGIYGLQVCRTRYIDDAITRALSGGIDQLVILGAGYDCRAYRLPEAERVRVFEVDLQAVQDQKKKQIQKHGRLTDKVTFVPIDFDQQSLEAAFAGTPFDSSKRAAVIWEGVTQYLSEDAVRRTMAYVGKLASGTVLVFTYVLKSVIERRSDIPGADKMMDTVAKGSAPWIFGLDPSEVETFLGSFHLRLQADVGNADYQRLYLEPLKRDLVVSEVERVVAARVESM